MIEEQISKQKIIVDHKNFKYPLNHNHNKRFREIRSEIFTFEGVFPRRMLNTRHIMIQRMAKKLRPTNPNTKTKISLMWWEGSGSGVVGM
jgi:hypothetical protein